VALLEGAESVACWHASCRSWNVRVTLQAFSKAVIDIAEMADVSEEDLLMARPFTGGGQKDQLTDLCLTYLSPLLEHLSLGVVLTILTVVMDKKGNGN